jgi:general secretion pathway protein D
LLRRSAPILALLLAGSLLAGGPSASELYNKGLAAEKKGRMAEAYLLYSEAAALEPQNEQYWLRSQAVRSRAALAMPRPAVPPPGSNPADASRPPALPEATAQDRAEARKPLPPSQLSASPGTQDFDLRGDSKTLFEDVARAFGLECGFDRDYEPRGPLRIQLKDVDYRDALHGLEAATGSFIVPLSNKLFMVAKDTPQKRTEVEPSVAVAVPLTEATTPQDFTALITGVQQSLALEKVAWDTQNNTVILRGAISKVLPARALLAELLHPRAQVMMELQFLEVSRNDVITYGIDFPDIFTLTPLTTWLNNTVSTPTSVAGFLAFGGGKTLMGIGIVNPSLVAQMSQSSGKLLLASQLRSVDGQSATLHIGDRYPVMTSRFFGDNSAYNTTTSGYAPSFTYEDLGLTVKVTPTVHGIDSLTLDMEAEYRVLTGEGLNGIPIISNRALKSKFRLETGQWAAIAGLLNTSDARTIAGLAGASRIPYLGALTSKRGHDTAKSEVLILMRPSLITLPPSEFATHAVRVGSNTRPVTPL